LIAASSCGTSVGCAANEYGAIAVGPGSLIAGFGIPRSLDGTLLWTSHEEGFFVRVHPGVQFSVTSILGTQTYVGEANLTLPKGMFAYVSLHDSDVGTPGVLGWFGGLDHFQSWVGSVDSRNLTVKVLVDSNKTIRAVWATDATFPVVLFVALTFALALVTLLIMSRRWKEKKRQSTFTRIDKLMRALSEVS